MMSAAPEGEGFEIGTSGVDAVARPGMGALRFAYAAIASAFEPPIRIAKSRVYDCESGDTSIVAPSVLFSALYRGEVSGRCIECGVAVLDAESSNSGSPSFSL